MSRRVLNAERNTRSSSERACFRTLSMGNFVESKKPCFVIQGSFLGRFSGFMIESPLIWKTKASPLAVVSVVFLTEPLPQRLQCQILGGGLVGILPRIAEFAVDHVHQALQIPAVQGDRASPFIRLDLAVEPKCLCHRAGMPLQFPQLVAGDQHLVADVSASRFHEEAPISSSDWSSLSACCPA